jgi:hypothetical protein
MSLSHVALKNLLRRRHRTALTLRGGAIGIVTSAVLMTMRASLNAPARFGPDHWSDLQ